MSERWRIVNLRMVMVAVLLASPGIAPHRLDVSVRRGTDPHVPPGRRNDERPDALQRLGIANAPPLGIDVHEPRARPPPPNPIPRIAHVPQPRHPRRLHGVTNDDTEDSLATRVLHE